jgi:thymidine phosphorylase
MFLPQDVIRKKRDGEQLDAAALRAFVHGVTSGEVNQGQIGAFTMATYLNGMTVDEQVALTLAMRDSGTVLDWTPLLPPGSRVIEKHSSGGVGDEKVTLLVLPVVAACGVFAPNISGRSLGHTGGELDLLEAIPGYTIEPPSETFMHTVRDAGTAIIGPTADLAPADRMIFHVRDVTATVESIPLIVSSILSKKLAAGPDGMVMTVPFGSGAFMRDEADAVQLATALVDVARAAGLPIVALISDCDSVLGDAVGNALQIREVIAFLNGVQQEHRLREVVLTIAAEIVLLAGAAPTLASAAALVAEKLADGSAARRFASMVDALGGPADLMDDPDRYLERAAIIAPVYAETPGSVTRMDCFRIGMALVTIGAGRVNPEDRIDFSVGISNVVRVGDDVDERTPLCLLHARTQTQWEYAAGELRAAFHLGAKASPAALFRGRLATSSAVG